jgi:S1-C subfamily serine protease
MNVAPGSKLQELGLRSGDRLVSLNGYRVASPEQSLAAYESLRGASEAGGPTVPGHAVLEIERDGKPVFLTYALE